MLFLVLQTAFLLLAVYILGACCGSLLYRIFYSGDQPADAAGSGVAFSEQPFIELETGPPPPAPNLAVANRFERALLGTRQRERRAPRLDIVSDVSQLTGHASNSEAQEASPSLRLAQAADELSEGREAVGVAETVEAIEVPETAQASADLGVIETFEPPGADELPVGREAEGTTETVEAIEVPGTAEASSVPGVIETSEPADPIELPEDLEVESAVETVEAVEVPETAEASGVLGVIETSEPAAPEELPEDRDVEGSVETVEAVEVPATAEVSSVLGVIEAFETAKAGDRPAPELSRGSIEFSDADAVEAADPDETTDTTETRAMMKQPSSVQPGVADPMQALGDHASLAPTLPVASSTGGITGTSAPLVVSAQQSADDLTRIYAIDAATAAQLAELGVNSYARLAAFTRADVDRIGATIERSRIWREGWIEQAQLLANGRETAYARKIAGGSDTLVPYPQARAEAATETAPEHFEKAPDTTETQTRDAGPASEAEPIAEPEPAAAIAAVAEQLAVAEPERVSETELAVEAVLVTEAETLGEVASAEPEIAPERVEPLAADGDDLTRIRGIDARAAGILRAHGVTSFRHIADMRTSELRELETLLDLPGQSRRHNWLKQARKLIKREAASATSQREETASGDAAGPDEPPPGSVTSTIVPPADTSDEAGVRGQINGDPATGMEAQASASGAVRGDDLKRIRGIGILIERKLKSLEICRYEQIANWTAAEIDRISQLLDFKGRIEREAWVEQARILVSGGRTEFSDRVDRQ